VVGIKLIDDTATDLYEFYDVNFTKLDQSYPIDMSKKTGVLLRQSAKKADIRHPESRLKQEALKFVAAKLRGGDAANSCDSIKIFKMIW
jgi:hypothetical protein